MQSQVMKKTEKKALNPLWRGAGCLLLVAIFIASFFLSVWFVGAVTANQVPMPPQLSMVPSSFRQMKVQFGELVPYILTPETGRIGKYIPELLLATVVSVIIFGSITAFYSIFRGNINDARDARDFQVKGRRKRNVRKCR